MPLDPTDDLAAIEAALSANGTPTAAQFKKLVEVISRSQLNYRELIDHLDHAVFTISLDGEIRVANKCLAEILGTSFQDLIGHRLPQFVSEPTLADAQRAIPGFLKNGSWSGRISVRRCNDDQLRLYDCWLQLLKDDETTSVSGWARDVTAQNESELRFTELFESLREGIIFTTPDGHLIDANPAFVRMLGYADKSELTRQNFASLYVHPEQRDKLVNQMLATGAIQDVDIIFCRKDGSHLHTLASGFAIRDTFGKIVRLQGTIVDVTERIEIEKRLQKEQEFVRQLVSSFPDMISVLDMNGQVTFVSPRIKEVLGYSADKLVGENFGSAIHRDDLPGIKETFRRIATGETASVLCEYRTLHSDSSWRILRASASPLFDGEGKINGVVASIRDVTDAKNNEKQAAQKEKLAAMGEMMSGVAHELNNPLTAILGISDLLYERSNDEVSKRQIGLVLKQARRAATIVQNLLSFSRPSALVSRKLAVEDVVRSVLSQQQILLKQKNIDVQFSAPTRLPPIQGDAKLLNQVFLNLMANAEQAILSGAGTGKIIVSIEPLDGKVAVKFLDDGPGIPADILGKVFDPFFTTKRPVGGTGLGLTICSAIVKEHGGTIEVQSVPGSGAEFSVLLPAFEELLPAPAQSAPSARAAATVPAGNAALKARTVFVVDDEESIREIVQEGLSSRGMAVEGAASSEDALAHLANHSYDFILCDFNLPGMNGEEFFRTLRSRNLATNTKFVFMTGAMLDPAALADFKEKGAYVLQKPFHIAALATLLVELLQPQLVKAD